MRHHCIKLILTLVTISVFGSVYTNDFVNWDDNINVYENPYLDPASFSSTLNFWQRPYNKLYIPVTYTIWSIEAGLSQSLLKEGDSAGLNPSIFHVVNLILHTFNVLVVFAILRLILNCHLPKSSNNQYKDWAAGLGALLFALHPVQIEPVSWVTGRKDVLYAFLSLVAIWQYLTYSSKKIPSPLPRTVHYIIASIAFVSAMLAKPTAVVVPIMAWLLDYCMLRRPAKECTVSLIGWVVLTLPIIILTKIAQPDSIIGFVSPLWTRAFIAGDSLAFYLYKLILPISLGPDYGRSPEFVINNSWIYFTWLIPFALPLIIYLLKNRKSYMAAAGIFVAGILPVLGLIPFSFQNYSTVGDRYLYISMLGPALAAALFFATHHRNSVLAVFILILILLGARSAFQIQYWRDSITLFEHALVVNPDSYLAHTNLGAISAKEGKLKQAIEHYSEALRIKPNLAEAYSNLGDVFKKQGNINEAAKYVSKALKIKPNLADAHFNLGVISGLQGKPDIAIKHYNEAIRIKPELVAAYNNLGIVLNRQGKFNEAVEIFNKALQIKPNNIGVYNNLGNILADRGKFDEAIKNFSIALKIKPNFAGTHNNIGTTLARQGRLDEAIVHFSKALRIQPGNKEARKNLSTALQINENKSHHISNNK